MTSEQIRTMGFGKAKQGYVVEDVDAFLLEVAADIQGLEQAVADVQQHLAQADAAKAQAEADKAEAENKMYILAQKVEEYRESEDTIKATLLNAQRMGETVVKEAKQKAEQLVRDASNQADLLRQQAEQEIDSERYLLENLRNQVTKFKATVLTLYKQHIESMSALDAPVAEANEELASFAEAKGLDPETFNGQETYEAEQAAAGEAQPAAEGEAGTEEVVVEENVYAANYIPVDPTLVNGESAPQQEAAPQGNLFDENAFGQAPQQ